MTTNSPVLTKVHINLLSGKDLYINFTGNPEEVKEELREMMGRQENVLYVESCGRHLFIPKGMICSLSCEKAFGFGRADS